MNAPVGRVLARSFPRRCRVLPWIQNDIVKIDIVAGVDLGTGDLGRHAGGPVRVPGEVYKRDVRNPHQAGSGIRPVIAAILANRRSGTGAVYVEIREEDVPDTPPPASTGFTRAFVRTLRHKVAHPRLDVCAIVHVFVVPDDLLDQHLG